MAERFSEAPIATPLVELDGNAGRVSRQWLPWINSLTLLVRGRQASTTWDPANVAAAASVTTTVTVPGATLGDYVHVSFSLSLQGLILTGYVSAATTVTVVLFNPTGGGVNLGSGTLRVYVRPGTA